MSDESHLITERRKKVADLREAGTNPYANGWRPTHTSGELKALAPELPPPEQRSEAAIVAGKFRVAGRVMAVRSAFMEIRDRDGRLQLYFKQDALGPDNWARKEHIERGDFIGAEGHIFYTKRGKSKDDRARRRTCECAR